MKTENVSTVQFSSKQRFVSPKQLELVREISKKMYGQSLRTSTENKFTASYIGAVSIGKFLLYNDTFLHGENENTAMGIIGKTQIKFDNKTITINNETGEVTNIKKPWHCSVSSILKKTENYLSAIRSNFDNEDVVSKNKLKIQGFTPKGFEKIMSGESIVDYSDGELNV